MGKWFADRKKSRRVVLGVERLEARDCPSGGQAYVWSPQGGSTSWITSNNWTVGGVRQMTSYPGDGDNGTQDSATLPSGSGNCTLDTTSTNIVNQLVLNDYNGTLRLNQPLFVAGLPGGVGGRFFMSGGQSVIDINAGVSTEPTEPGLELLNGLSGSNVSSWISGEIKVESGKGCVAIHGSSVNTELDITGAKTAQPAPVLADNIFIDGINSNNGNGILRLVKMTGGNLELQSGFSITVSTLGNLFFDQVNTAAQKDQFGGIVPLGAGTTYAVIDTGGAVNRTVANGGEVMVSAGALKLQNGGGLTVSTNSAIAFTGQDNSGNSIVMLNQAQININTGGGPGPGQLFVDGNIDCNNSTISLLATGSTTDLINNFGATVNTINVYGSGSSGTGQMIITNNQGVTTTAWVSLDVTFGDRGNYEPYFWGKTSTYEALNSLATVTFNTGSSVILQIQDSTGPVIGTNFNVLAVDSISLQSDTLTVSDSFNSADHYNWTITNQNLPDVLEVERTD